MAGQDEVPRQPPIGPTDTVFLVWDTEGKEEKVGVYRALENKFIKIVRTWG